MDITAFVSTVGDQTNFVDCIEHLQRQTVEFQLDIIDHVAPMFAAFQQMLDRCKTKYYVQVDEDMILHPTAIERLYSLIASAPPHIALIIAPLWDCDMEAPLYGVKVYRHEIVRRFPYEDALGCERAQATRIRQAGYAVGTLPLCGKTECFGEHGKHYTPKSLFARWQRVLQKHRRYADMKWAEAWPQRLLARYVETGERLHLYALVGAIAGIVGPEEPDKEKDWRREVPNYAAIANYFPDDGPNLRELNHSTSNVESSLETC
jgi:hypothetical protein